MHLKKDFLINDEQINRLKIIILNAGQIALECRDRGITVENKDDNSPVSNADKEISLFIYQKLYALAPNIPIICEEQEKIDVSDCESFWLIDPIDGTRSYIRGETSFTINIALIVDKRPKLGFIYQPDTEKLYYTDSDGKCCIEEAGQIVPCSAFKDNNEGLTAIISSEYVNRATQEYLAKHEFVNIIAIPSSIKLCMIAEGIGDIYPKFDPTMEWDIAAGHAIVNASGGRVTDILGHDITYAKPYFQNSEFLASGKRWQPTRA